jgi:hypothetical protein
MDAIGSREGWLVEAFHRKRLETDMTAAQLGWRSVAPSGAQGGAVGPIGAIASLESSLRRANVTANPILSNKAGLPSALDSQARTSFLDLLAAQT